MYLLADYDGINDRYLMLDILMDNMLDNSEYIRLNMSDNGTKLFTISLVITFLANRLFAFLPNHLFVLVAPHWKF